jgi:hypothetical protein
MKSYSQLLARLAGLSAHLDGELWDKLLTLLDPPKAYGSPSECQDMAFRDAKALAGYVPDLRNLMAKTSPKELAPEELQSLTAIWGFYQLAARLPVLLLSLEEHKANEQLIDLYNGFRQILLELKEYHSLAS